jgi:hypothetical protein
MLAALGAAPAPQAAQAQALYGAPYPFPFYRGPVPYGAHHMLRERISARLAREGYRLIGQLQREDDAVVVFGADAYGQRARFVIDPADGAVLEKQRLQPSAAAYLGDPRYGGGEPPWRASGLREPAAPAPTRERLSEAFPPQAAERPPAASDNPKIISFNRPKTLAARTSPNAPVSAAPTPPRRSSSPSGAPAAKSAPAPAALHKAPAGSAHRAITPPSVAAPSPVVTPSPAPAPIVAGPAPAIPPILQSYQGLKPPPSINAQRPDGG